MTTTISTTDKASKPLAIVSLVTGILSFITPAFPIAAFFFSWIFEIEEEGSHLFLLFYLGGFILSVVAIITGVIALIQIGKKDLPGKGYAIIGMILAGVGIVVASCMTMTSFFMD